MLTGLYVNVSDAQWQFTPQSVVESRRNPNSSKLLQLSTLPIKMEMIQSKIKAVECLRHFSHCKSMGSFSDAQGQLTPQSVFESGQNLNSYDISWMSSLPVRMKERSNLYKGAGVLTRLYIDSSHTQRQVTPQYVVESHRNSNSSKSFSLLPARMKKIQ